MGWCIFAGVIQYLLAFDAKTEAGCRHYIVIGNIWFAAAAVVGFLK